MTLRDYFAAAALSGLLADSNYGEGPKEAGEWCYDYADAMLEARKR